MAPRWRFLEVTSPDSSPLAHDGPTARTRDDVKTLTMLSLAAHSRSIKTRDTAAGPGTTPATTDTPEDSR